MIPALLAPCGAARAATPFQNVPDATPRAQSHRLAYATIVGGAGLIAGSFAVAHHADGLYDRYLASTDPAEADRLYASTKRWDNTSSAMLIGGEALVVAGVWLRFLHHGAPAFRVSLHSCAVSCSF